MFRSLCRVQAGLKKHRNCMNCECRKPCDHTLADDNKKRPFSAKLPLDRCNRSHTGSIQQAKYEKRRSSCRRDRSKKRFRSAEQHRQRRDNTFFAINPVTSAVDIRQSPNPSGAKTGERAPAIIAKILSFESVTIFRLVSKLCKNQITIVARKITVNARCRKSRAFSQSSWPTFFAPGIR